MCWPDTTQTLRAEKKKKNMHLLSLPLALFVTRAKPDGTSVLFTLTMNRALHYGAKPLWDHCPAPGVCDNISHLSKRAESQITKWLLQMWGRPDTDAPSCDLNALHKYPVSCLICMHTYFFFFRGTICLEPKTVLNASSENKTVTHGCSNDEKEWIYMQQ